MASNTISGKIVQKETGLGIPDLLVVLYDLDPGTKPEESFDPVPTTAPAPPSARAQIPGDRIGSVLTGADGAFTLGYEDADFRLRNTAEMRPDLVLLVMAPEEAGQPDGGALFVSTPVRQNAGRTEQYLVRLTGDQLAKAGIPLPETPGGAAGGAASAVTRLVGADEQAATVIDGLRQVNQNRVARVRRTAAEFHATLQPQIRQRLSRIPETGIDPATVVAAGESVADKTGALIQQNLAQVINSDDPAIKPPIKTFVALTDAQKTALAGKLDADGTVDAQTLGEILGTGAAGGAAGPQPPTRTFLVREDPRAQFCRDRTDAEIAGAAALGVGDATPPAAATPGPGGDIPAPALAAGDILRYAGRLMDTVTSPEEKILIGLEPRADRTTVDTEIQGLSFAPSPADVPAFYDFHNLQIAFEHVWKEVIDEGLVTLGQDAYHQIVELGGDPVRNPGMSVDPLFGLAQEGRTVLTAQRVVRDHRSGNSLVDGLLNPFGGFSPGGTPPPRGNPGQEPVDPLERLPALLAEMESRLKEEYAFTIYAADRKERSVNFAILITYRQKWDPLGYQAGRLVRTLTLAPRETRRYSRKTSTHRKRAVKEVDSHLRDRKDETSQTSRSEQDIVAKATHSTNFSLTAQGTVSVPEVGDATTTTSFQQAASKSSEDTKKQFHEAVVKAAQEFRDETTTEVDTEDTTDIETVEAGEITNPNDELALTCLFYELQRRYRVTEQIRQITPVILVAQEVPRPDEIDEAWILANDWILRRALLDDSFLPALNYLAQSVVGDEIALGEQRVNVLQQRRVVDELRSELGVVRDRVSFYRSLLERSLLQKAAPPNSDGGGGGPLSFIPVVGDLADDALNAVAGAAGAVGDFLFSGNAAGQSGQDAIKDALDRSADDQRDLLFRLEREVTALNDMTQAYAKGLADHFNQKAQIDRLRIHLKQNILYYMQAIWSYEPPDQRFFRLHKTRVPVITPASHRYHFPGLTAVQGVLAAQEVRRLARPGPAPTRLYGTEVRTKFQPTLTFTTLAEAADLDNFLGFKGNYMMFPLRQSNPLTDYMMHPYVVAGLDELVDPDDAGNWTLEDFSRYIVCLEANLSADDFAAIRPDLLAQYQTILTNPRPNGDEITVPANSLFIAMLPDTHTVLEQFKAEHRMIDVKKVQAEVRQAELENVRLAARILAGEHEDPHIDKMIVVEGGPVPVQDV